MSGNIEINRIKVEGVYEFDKTFGNGLHILVGTKNSCGKSLFIHLIDYALGDDGKELENYSAILKKCSNFYAELKINDEKIIIKRNLYIINNDIEVFMNTTIDEIISKNLKSEPISCEDYQKMLFKKMTNYDYIPIVSEKSGKSGKITFPVFSNLFYLNQGVAAGQLFRYHSSFFPDYMKEKILSLYFNTKKILASAHEVSINDLKNKVGESIKDLNIQKVFFNTNFISDNYYAEISKGDKIRAEITLLRLELNKINEGIYSSGGFPEKDRIELYSLKKLIEENEINLMDSELFIKQTTKILNDYSEEISKTEKNIKSYNIFKKFDIAICPECNSNLESEDKDHCSLCKTSLNPEVLSEDYFTKNMQYLTYLRGALKDTLDVISNEKEKKKSLLDLKEKLQRQHEDKEKVLDNYIQNNGIPLIEKASKISSDIARKEQELLAINRNIAILSSFLDEDKKIKDWKEKIKDLKEKIGEINNDVLDMKKEKDLLGVLEENFNSFFNQVNYPGFQSATVDNQFKIEVNSFKDGTQKLEQIAAPSNKVALRLGLFYAILKTALYQKEINHPRLFYLDSPRDQELTWERFCNSLNEFKTLLETAQKSKINGQVFVTIVEDGKNLIKDYYPSLENNVFMRISNEENLMLLRKKIN